MPETVIKFQNVTKSYGGARGITNVSLDVMPGEVYGFLGPNGAGKTTSISLMVDLIRPTSGKISIFGLDSIKSSVHIHQRIGFLTDDMAMDKGLTGWQQLEYFGGLRGNFNKKMARELAERLNCKLSAKFKSLSRGNRQKVGLISALMHDPELLILDEPTSGLDPLIQAEFNKIILERRDQGKTAFISSHILSEVQELCDRVAFIKEGKIIGVKGLEELGQEAPSQIHIHTADKRILQVLRKTSGIKNLTTKAGSISCTFTGDINNLLGVLSKFRLSHLTVQDADLETMFMKYYRSK